MGIGYRSVGAAIALLGLATCLGEHVEEDLPPGVAHLQNAEGGGGFELFIEFESES